MKENATAETTVENWVSQRDQAKAQLELSQINLGYTRGHGAVRGPAGRPPGRSGEPRGLERPDRPRHDRAAPPHLRQLQSQRARRAAHARHDARSKHRARLEHRQGAGRSRSPERAGLSPRGRARFRRQLALDLDGDDRSARRLQERGHDPLPGPLRPRADSPRRSAADARDPRRSRSATTSRAISSTSWQRDDVVERRTIVKGPLTANGPGDPKRRRGGRPRHRQRAAQRARRREGRSDDGPPPTPRRPPASGNAPSGAPSRRARQVLHRASGSRERHRVRDDPARAVALGVLPVSQYPPITPPDGAGHDDLSGREREDARRDGRAADRAAGQRRREDALHAVQLHRRTAATR